MDKLQQILRDVEYGETYSSLELELQRLRDTEDTLNRIEEYIYFGGEATNYKEIPQNI